MDVARGALRVYLGAAPGVGKTVAMLEEGNRRAARGTDVVVAFVESHGRQRTADATGELEVVPRRLIRYRGGEFAEMDLDAVLARKPELALVDELAHTDIPGSRHEKRWQDIEDLLAAGIDVLSTVNVQHLESVNDLVERITGAAQRETVPDAVVRAAEQIHLVDQTPEALRRRMAHGNIYAPDKIDAALANYFRVGNLSALRELALLWVADRVDEGMRRYRTDHDIEATWETRERVVVALTGGPEGATLIRRATRIATRGGAELLAVHVARSDGLAGADTAELAAQRTLVESLDGSYHVVRGDDVTEALLGFARSVNATQLVLGASRRSTLAMRLSGQGIGARTVRRSGDIDVHIVTHEHVGAGREPALRLGRADLRRTVRGAVFAVLLLTGLTSALANLRTELNLTSCALLYLLTTVAVALVGGVVVSLLTAVAASLLLNYYFTEPFYRFTIAERDNSIGLSAFVVVAALVAVLVDRAERRRREAARNSAEAEVLATVAGTVLRGGGELPALLGQLAEIFAMTGVALLTKADDGWQVAVATGPGAPATPDAADTVVRGDDGVALAMCGPAPAGGDLRVLTAFASQAAASLRTQQLAAEAQAAAPLRAADRTRTALLQAVSHDLRTPLASAKAAVSSLRGGAVDWSPEDTAELLATADESLDKLARLVANLLDMSRLQAGAMPVAAHPVDVGDVIARALDALGPGADAVTVVTAAELPDATADAGLLERALANVLENALRFAPPDRPPVVTASAHDGRVEIRVVDRGTGLPDEAKQRVFAPFQRLGDTSNTTGVGLGLALARGLTEAMGGQLLPEDTPGGGLTMVISLAAAPATVPAAC